MFSKGLLSASELNQKETLHLISNARNHLKASKSKTGVLAFFESSSRTYSSFRLAGIDLGIEWLDFEAEKSSLRKGESFRDSLQLFAHYPVDFLVLRHPHYGACFWAQRWLQKPVVNAGEACHEHPTQGLGDALCLHDISKSKSWKICFFGDLLKSRVFRSCVQIFKKMKWNVFICRDQTQESFLLAKIFGLKMIDRSDLKKMDVIYTLRAQKERGGASFLGPLRLSEIGKEARVMHAGPVIWEEDLEQAFQFIPERLLIDAQVKSCFIIRRKLLSEVARGRR
jgi:aspartate carbamoyltransferase catalytic subunit